MQPFLRFAAASLLSAMITPGGDGARAGTSSLGIDHKVPLDESGIWSRDVQEGVFYGSVVTVLGGAHW